MVEDYSFTFWRISESRIGFDIIEYIKICVGKKNILVFWNLSVNILPLGKNSYTEKVLSVYLHTHEHRHKNHSPR